MSRAISLTEVWETPNQQWRFRYDDEDDLVVEDTQPKSQNEHIDCDHYDYWWTLMVKRSITQQRKWRWKCTWINYYTIPKDTRYFGFGGDAWPIANQVLFKVGYFSAQVTVNKMCVETRLIIGDCRGKLREERDGSYYRRDWAIYRWYLQSKHSKQRKLHIPITTFMITKRSLLQKFLWISLPEIIKENILY
jgi:hypothetical protein